MTKLSKVVIECILLREGGTKVHFGRGKDAVEYHFKPEAISGPHVAEVPDTDHALKLLAVPESFVLVSGDVPGYEPAVALAEGDDGGEADDVDTSDLTTLDASTMTNKQLARFVETELSLNPTDKKALIAYGKNTLSLDLKSRDTANELSRQIVAAIVEIERAAADAEKAGAEPQ